MFTQHRWRIAAGNLVLIVLAFTAFVIYVSARTSVNHTPDPNLVADFIVFLAVDALITGVLSYGLTMLLTRGMARPIVRYTTIVQQIGNGNLEIDIPVESADEVGQLGIALKAMARALDQRLSTLESQRAEVSAILASMADGVIIVNDGERVSSLNRAAARMLDISADFAIGKTVTEIIRRHELISLLTGHATSDGPLVIEVGPDRRQVQVVITPVIVGRHTRQIVVFQDVTALRRAEAIRRDFVANVSHELRTPLASLRALVETLEDGALEEPAAAREFLTRMHAEVDGLTQMVTELLELARIESGRVEMRFEEADLVEVVREAAERLRPQAERQGISLAISPGRDSILVVVDIGRLHQVVVNLVHNAIKFTPPGGHVWVSVERRGTYAAVIIADDGQGVSAEDLPRLFERFYKVDRSRATLGTGLGLAIVKHLVQAHGGQVWATSPGQDEGATFTALLPLAGPVAPRDPRLHAPSPRLLNNS
ncbi:MAG TPA: ATP-binding protein [Chloroflexota bacterium]|nr:ATP-binding protein [Chloroflexota bacterium]